MTHFPHFTRLLLAGEPVRICLFGSSTVEGIGASTPENGFGPVFERTFAPYAPGGLTVINRGIGGNGAHEMHDRLQQVIDDKADLVIWQGGTNDVLRNAPVATFIDLSRDDLSTLRRHGSDLAMIGPQWCKMLEDAPSFPAFRDAVPALALEMGVPFFDRYRHMKSWCAEYNITRETLSPDNLHMGDFGYKLLGESTARWIIDLTGAPGSDTGS
ncbi:SGNH/GDSL hydrolase family protein [Acetobacter fallax]|uniref:SGNH/GDSL hydrolase family protein n=1 Tax=Acetobacter fallax TaxID=1737473 RepID=A0ABX0KDC7_9PROT|nr:SGNH/GDSL hydrolase family protein [Acetobacter fallax]NHO33141.1 SGNH/GDSL hydrolase family protein [Acetobacter fallax]NHO36838.1 SGNH/GDSL hydrolase family protein [Acetobacter fallax]